jgi:GT2 family glycosyltransferase
MDLDISIIIPSFKRSQLLRWCLFSLARQSIPYRFETIVLNDGIEDETSLVCWDYRRRLNLQYIFSGQRNTPEASKWRVPGFAVNIGARVSRGQMLIICDAEMFHLNDTITQLIKPVELNSQYLGTPILRDDREGSFLKILQAAKSNIWSNKLGQNCPRLNSRLPFLMSLSRKSFFAVGGYDEDFTGRGWEDNDFIARLRRFGCRHILTGAKAIHLFHNRYNGDKSQLPEYIYNHRLYQRNNQENRIISNKGRLWGQIV